MHFYGYLNILVNVIVENYFQNMTCFMHVYDNINLSPINLLIPHYIFKNVSNIHLNPHYRCPNILLECTNISNAFNEVENVIKRANSGIYNNRKYLLVISNSADFEEFFNLNLLTFVRDILIIYIGKEDNSEFKHKLIPHSLIHDKVYFTFYTHQYIGIEGNNNPIMLDIWYGKNQTFRYNNILYPDKITDQMGRELRVSCKKYPPYAFCYPNRIKGLGNEQNMVLKFSQRYNFTLKIDICKEKTIIFSNWTGYGCRLGLINDDNYYDIVFGGRRWTPNTDFIISVVYKYEVSVPMPMIYYGWLWVFKMFRTTVWFLLLFAVLLIYLIIHLRRLLFQNISRTSQMKNIEIFGLFINQSAPMSHEWKNSITLKFLSLLILYSSILYCAAYNSRLSSIMVIPMYKNDINSLEEFAKSDLLLMFFDDYFGPLASDVREVYHKIYTKIYLLPKKKDDNYDLELSEKQLSSRKYGVARYRRFEGGYNEENEILQQMYGKFKPITPPLFLHYYALLLRKNSMHTITLTGVVTSATETGLVSFWEQNALRLVLGNTTYQKMIQDTKVNHNEQNLNMKNLKGCFAFWLISMVFSFIVFLLEIYTSRYKGRLK